MGIGPEAAEMLRSLPLEAGFSVCELGNQIWHLGSRKLWRHPAIELYESLGCGSYLSLDANGRDGAAVIDLNRPLDFQGKRNLFGRFDLVTDFGTTEHIFEIGQAWRTIHDICKPGGIIAFLKPHQGHASHCFYNVNEAFFRDIAKANDYDIMALRLFVGSYGENWLGWMRKPAQNKSFSTPQQGKYRSRLKI